MRESGNYWVKKSGSWYVAEYTSEADRFLLPGVLLWYNDSDFEAIDEKRIVRDDTPAAHKLGYTPDQL